MSTRTTIDPALAQALADVLHQRAASLALAHLWQAAWEMSSTVSALIREHPDQNPQRLMQRVFVLRDEMGPLRKALDEAIPFLPPWDKR